MSVDWNVVATIISPIVTLFVGVWINRKFENRATLISYFGHVAAFVHKPESGDPIKVHTHTVVLRNTGRKSATNVRLHHKLLPDFNIYPTIMYTVEDLPDGSKDIVIPTLIPSKQITISYLYFPPFTVAEVNAGIEFDQGFAHAIPVLLQRQYPKWLGIISIFLMLVGIVSLVYICYSLIFL